MKPTKSELLSSAAVPTGDHALLKRKVQATEWGVYVNDVFVPHELLFAAPEMLEALEKALPLLKTYNDDTWWDVAYLVEKIIAKAKGEA